MTLFAGIGALSSPSGDDYSASTMFSYFFASALVGTLLLVSAYISFMRILGRQVDPGFWWKKLSRWFHPKRLLFSFPLILAAGYLAEGFALSRWLILPMINIYSLSLPVLIMVWLAVRGLEKGTYQRDWGALSLGLILTPAVAIFLEVIVLVALIIGLSITAVNDPSLSDLISNLEQVAMGKMEPAFLDRVVTEMVQTPIFFASLLIWVAGFVPLIEELFKPIAVWVLAGRKLRPVDGWVIGSLSGAGFALFENFGNAAVSEDWLIGIISRSFTSVPHVFTAGLMGYTFALARNNKKYGRVLIIYLAVVVIHGIWNASSMLTLAASFASQGSRLNADLPYLYLTPIGILAVGMLIATIRFNRKLQSEAEPGDAPLVDPMPGDLLTLNSEQDHME